MDGPPSRPTAERWVRFLKSEDFITGTIASRLNDRQRHSSQEVLQEASGPFPVRRHRCEQERSANIQLVHIGRCHRCNLSAGPNDRHCRPGRSSRIRRPRGIRFEERPTVESQLRHIQFAVEADDFAGAVDGAAGADFHCLAGDAGRLDRHLEMTIAGWRLPLASKLDHNVS